jgi:putative colanic acid biosynthesis UDP-glucose lipid carrier transferase
VGDIPTVSIHETPFYGVDGWVKRVEDIVLSSVILALIAIPMLIIATGVKFSSPGPVIFRQRRYGLSGQEIEVWKFRSMTVCENGDDVRQATKCDPRITAFGAFLRRTSLDELPQFINVLQGRMSIVGPRPHAIAHNEEYRKLISGYMLRHKVKPGITGWAQINGWRGETESLDKMRNRVEHDLTYIRNWSLWLDIKIILVTALKGFCGKNAY